MTRYLQVQAQGIPRWLGQPATTPAQRVFWGLLQMPGDVALVPAELAARWGLALADFSRALFELNRDHALRVSAEAHSHADQFSYDFALLREDLRQLGGENPQLLLAGADGLCLAQQGLPDEVCTYQAAVSHAGSSREFPCVVPLHLGAAVVRLCSPHAIDTANAALLRLVRRLIGLQQIAETRT